MISQMQLIFQIQNTKRKSLTIQKKAYKEPEWQCKKRMTVMYATHELYPTSIEQMMPATEWQIIQVTTDALHGIHQIWTPINNTLNELWAEQCQ